MTYLTVPISASDLQQAAGQLLDAKAAGAEAIELRTDYLVDLNIASTKKLVCQALKTALPVIVTCRDKQEGGATDYPVNLRIDVLTAAIKAGADFIDFEYENFQVKKNQDIILSALSKSKTKLILSEHNFKGRFGNIRELYGDILKSNPQAIPKLVYTANHINDCFEAYDLLHSKKGDVIVLCMGEAGLSSRIIAKKSGGLVSYASLNEKSATAAGQITIEQMKNLYRWDKINSATALYGIIGSPVAHSLSPLIHNKCFEKIGANKLYLPLLVEGSEKEFDEFMENCLSRPYLDFRGFSITIPHKENALKFVRQNGGFVEPLTGKIGAANTIIIERQIFTTEGTENAEKKESEDKKRKIAAYNTDYAGALDAITAGMGIKRDDLKGLPVAVIGAGGVARAIVAGLSDCGAKIKIYNRTVKRAKRLAKEFGCDFAGLEELPNLNAKLVINCTSVGMHPKINETPIPKKLLESASLKLRRSGKDMAVFDTVYNPAETLLLKQAKKVGAKTISGLDMFIFQAAEQFKLFTGKNADITLMRKTIIDYLSKQ
jgi:3-dehydroquinate dehydratase / shikimate dehydrogenase